MLQSAAGSGWASRAAGFASAGQKTPPTAVSGADSPDAKNGAAGRRRLAAGLVRLLPT